MDQDNHPYIIKEVYIFYNTNDYSIKKNYSYSIKFLQELTLLEFLLVGIDTSPPIRFVLCLETEITSTKEEENMKKLKVNNNIYYDKVSNKPKKFIIGITLSMWKQHTFESIFTSDDVLNI